MEWDARDDELVPSPDEAIASAAQYLLSRGNDKAAELLLACGIEYVGVDPPADTGAGVRVHIEVFGPARLYDIFTVEEYGDDSDKRELLIKALVAPLPSFMHGYPATYAVHARAQVVTTYEGWRDEFKATASGFGITNQGVNPDGTRAPLRWVGNNFRTQGEIAVAKALDAANVLFFPLPRAAVGVTPDHRTMAEPDFVVCDQGKWGIIEIDGSSHEGRYAHDQERDRLISLHGIRVIQHFTEEQARASATQVVAEFIDQLKRNG